MKAWLIAGLAGLLVIAGCSRYETTADLQQEKLLLDLMKTQNDQLVQLAQKESDLRGLAKKNEEALQDIARQRAALQTLQQEAAGKTRVAEEAIAKEKATLQTVRDGLAAEEQRVRAEVLKCQAAEKQIAAQREELGRLRAIVQADRHAAPRAAAAARPAAEEKARAEIDARVKKRQPYLQELATLTANFFPSAMARSTMRSEVLNLLTQAKVAETKEDDAFVDGALAIAESFYLNKTKYPYMTYEKKAFDQWGQMYLKTAAPAAS